MLPKLGFDNLLPLLTSFIQRVKAGGFNLVLFHDDLDGSPGRMLKFRKIKECIQIEAIYDTQSGEIRHDSMVPLSLASVKTCFSKLQISLKTTDGSALHLVAMPVEI